MEAVISVIFDNFCVVTFSECRDFMSRPWFFFFFLKQQFVNVTAVSMYSNYAKYDPSWIDNYETYQDGVWTN